MYTCCFVFSSAFLFVFFVVAVVVFSLPYHLFFCFVLFLLCLVFFCQSKYNVCDH